MYSFNANNPGIYIQDVIEVLSDLLRISKHLKQSQP